MANWFLSFCTKTMMNFFVPPFLAGDFEALFTKDDFSTINTVTLVTALNKVSKIFQDYIKTWISLRKVQALFVPVIL